MGYKNYYSKDFGTLRPITKEGKFYEPFDPKEGAQILHLVPVSMKVMHGITLSLCLMISMAW